MGDQIKQTIVVQKGKQILNERGRSAFDIEATGLGVRKGSAGGPIMINMIRPFEIAIGTDMSGSISKLLHEKACLNSHLIAGSALAVTPIAPTPPSLLNSKALSSLPVSCMKSFPIDFF